MEDQSQPPSPACWPEGSFANTRPGMAVARCPVGHTSGPRSFALLKSFCSRERTISRITNPGRCAGQRRLDGTWRFLQRSPHRPPRGRTAPRHSCREDGGVEGETRRDLAFLTDHAPIRRRRRPTGGRRPGPACERSRGPWRRGLAPPRGRDGVIERPDAPCRPGPPTARASAGQRPGRRRPRPRRCRLPSPCTGRCAR